MASYVDLGKIDNPLMCRWNLLKVMQHPQAIAVPDKCESVLGANAAFINDLAVPDGRHRG